MFNGVIIPEVRGHLVNYSMVSPRYSFRKNSKFEEYLRSHAPALFPEEVKEFSLSRVLLAISTIVEVEKLFDPENPSLIWGDAEFSQAIGTTIATNQSLSWAVKDALLDSERRSIIGPNMEDITYVMVVPPEEGKKMECLIGHLHSNVPLWGSDKAFGRLALEKKLPLITTVPVYRASKEMIFFLGETGLQAEEESLISFDFAYEQVRRYLNSFREVLTNPRHEGYYFLPEGNPLSLAFGGIKLFARRQLPYLVNHTLQEMSS